MRKIKLRKVTGFRVKDVNKPIVIRDKRGVLFYDTSPLIPKVKRFNLPAGIELYVDSGSFVPMNKPYKYRLSKLPKIQRHKQSNPSNFKIEFGYNPHKATVYWDQKKIFFDDSFKEKPLPMLYFILYHEFGHKLFKTEKFADQYAKNMMLKRGYNPLQIVSAQLWGLSSQNYDRKRYIVKHIINLQR